MQHASLTFPSLLEKSHYRFVALLGSKTPWAEVQFAFYVRIRALLKQEFSHLNVPFHDGVIQGRTAHITFRVDDSTSFQEKPRCMPIPQ
jgi:hypothetical protein